MSLAKDDRKLLFERLVAQERVDGFAACNNVLFRTRTAVRLGEQMLNACIRLRQWLLAEEAVSALLKAKPIKLLHACLGVGLAA